MAKLSLKLDDRPEFKEELGLSIGQAINEWNANNDNERLTDATIRFGDVAEAIGNGPVLRKAIMRLIGFLIYWTLRLDREHD